jgi:nitroreductase
MGPSDRPALEELLTTTRSVRRRLDLDRPVDLREVVDAVRIALQAPSGSNRQAWRWVLVTDEGKRAALAELFKAGGQKYVTDRLANAGSVAEQRLFESAQHLLDTIHRVPVLAIPCIEGRPEGRDAAGLAGLYGSVLPSVWSFMLALRTRGLVSAWTTFHTHHEADAAAILGIPATVTQVALLPVAHPIGDSFRPAPRNDVNDVVFLNDWGTRPTS